MSDSENDIRAPDYSPVVNAYQAIADYAKGQGAEALAWAKDMIAKNTDLTNLVNSGNLGIGDALDDAARADIAAGRATRDEATQFTRQRRDQLTDPFHKAQNMGAAGAQAAQATEAARDAATRELESYGVNPGAVRFAALDIPARLQSAAIRVGAENIAARTDEQMADQQNQMLQNQGNVTVGQGQSAAGGAVGARNSAIGNSLNNTATGYQGLGTDLAWTGARSGAVGGQGNALSAGFQNEAAAAKNNRENSSGIGSLLGLGASMLGKGGAFGAGGALAFLADGGAVDDIDGGGAVPVEMSPSGGAAIDDIPAVSPNGPARLNAGEFVIPEDVTRWKGEEWLQNLIRKTREQMGKDKDAKPKQAQAPSGPPVSMEAFENGGAVEDRRRWTHSDNARGRRRGTPEREPERGYEWEREPPAHTRLSSAAGSRDLEDEAYSLPAHTRMESVHNRANSERIRQLLRDDSVGLFRKAGDMERAARRGAVTVDAR